MNHLWKRHPLKNKIKINTRPCLISQGSFHHSEPNRPFSTAAVPQASVPSCFERRVRVSLCFIHLKPSMNYWWRSAAATLVSDLSPPSSIRTKLRDHGFAVSEMLKMVPATQKIPEGWNRAGLEVEGMSGGAAELNIYWEITLWVKCLLGEA